jgi:hypothetical protein
MANLLPRASERDEFPALDPDRLARCAARVSSAARLGRRTDVLARVGRGVEALTVLLEELETDPAPTVADELLEAIEQERRRMLEAIEGQGRTGLAANGSELTAATPPAPEVGGLWLVYRPGRSLGTGESDLASRGLFDARDRPPLGCWIEAVARTEAGRPGRFDLAILVWMPEAERARATAGCEASATGALGPLASLSSRLLDQLGPLLARRSGA